MKRIISLILTLAAALSLLVLPAGAVSTPEEALGEVNIYNGGYRMAYLAVNGEVQSQNYAYFLYRNSAGEVQEIPAYCVTPNQRGVHKVVAEGESVRYLAEEAASDPKIVGMVANMYPHRSLAELGLDNKYQAFYAGKIALWCYLIPDWDIRGVTVAPGLTGTEREIGEKILNAVVQIYNEGTQWTQVAEPRLTTSPDRETAYPVTIGGQTYYQQVFTVESPTWVDGRAVNVSFQAGSDVPEGTRIVDEENRDITQVEMSSTGTRYSYAGKFKVLYPAEAVTGKTGSVQLTLSADVYQYVVFYALCQEKDKYGNLQNYLCDTDPKTSLLRSAVSNYSDSPDGEPEGTALRITKYEAGTTVTLSGASFEVVGPEGDTIGIYTTPESGSITIPLTEVGNYTIYERQPPAYHLLDEEPVKQVTVRYGEVAEVSFENEPYGDLRIEKIDGSSGASLSGAKVQIRHIESGAVYADTTGTGGSCTFTQLRPGAYEILELAAPEGWQRDPQTYTTTVVAGECVTYILKNDALPGLKIIKYDRGSHEVMSGVTFRIWRDGTLLGDFETDELGEILLTDCQPGTYRVQEVDTGDSGHLLDSAPQEIELEAGGGIKELVFFNDKKPGIWLVKVDSSDLSKPIANAKFRFEAVDGSFGPVEYTTLEDGTIDLSELPTGAYVVTELECPGYVIDDAQRIIQLEADQTAEFVFTNSKLPSLTLTKLSSDGSPLAGASYSLTRIEDGSRYMDQTTSTAGTITWEGLEPGVYSLKETDTVSDHILDTKEYHVELFPGKGSTIVLENSKRPNLTVVKRDADSGAPVADAVFLVEAADGHSVDELKTGADGTATLENLLPGVYEVTEKSVPAPYLLDAEPQLVTLYPDRDRTVYFENHRAPVIEIIKENEITHDPIENVPFQIWYASNNTSTGEYNDLGVYYTDEEGRIVLSDPELFLRDGWFRIEELEPPKGFSLTESSKQEAFIAAGEGHTFRIYNRPNSAIVVWKYDSVHPEQAIEGAVFQVRYLSGNTSGTGGTVIGTYRTSPNGSFTVTDCKPGTYIIEELSSDGSHVIDTPPQTVYLSGEEQEVIQVHFGNSPMGSLLIKKVSSTDIGDDRDDDPTAPNAFRQQSPLSQHISFLKDFFRAYKPFTHQQIDTLELMLERLYRKWGISDETGFSAMEPEDWPIAEDLYAVLEDAYEHYDREDSPLYPRELLRELLLGLHSMCRGAESVYFNGRTNITSARFLVFGVKDLIHANSSVKDALLFNLLSYLSDQLLTKGNTVAALDELYLWLSNLTTIEYIRNCLKRVRKRNSALILASQNLEDFDIQGVRELTRPLFAIPTHQFLFHGGKVDRKFYMDNLQLESAEYDLISAPQRGVCLFKSGTDRNLLDVHAPPHKHALITGGEG